MGDRIAARTRVGVLAKGILTIKVSSAAWSTELGFLKPEILRRLQAGGLDVTDLRFKIDAGSSEPTKRLRSPFANPGAPAAVHEEEEVPLPDELLARLHRIEDPTLRAAIAEAARVTLNRSKPGSRK